MNVYHVIESVKNPNAGPSYSVPAMLDGLNQLKNVDATLITTGIAEYESKFKHDVINVKSHAYLDPFGVTSGSRQLKGFMSEGNIIHGHGVWRPSNLVYLLKDKDSKCKLLCSPRGMLTEWAMSHRKLRKAPFWRTLQKPALDRVDCFHVTAESELEDIRRLGFKQPAAIIPNGVDVPILSKDVSKDNTILFLSRLNKKKGLDILLESWKRIYNDHPQWKLVVAGPQYESFAKNLIKRSEEIGLKNIEFVGETLGEDKINLFQSSKIFVLPSYSENFGIVIAEALSNAVPVITTTGTPWSEIIDNRCGWYISPNTDELTHCLREAIELSDEELLNMGLRGREWMQKEFGWENISTTMHSVYEWLLGSKESKPDIVVTER